MSKVKLNTDYEQGFTLIELLIVLALLSVILAGLFNLFSFTYNNFAWVEGESHRLQTVRLSLDLLGNDIRNAEPFEDQLIGVKIESNGTKLYLGPEGNGQIRYEVKDKGLWRQVHDGKTFKDQPGKILDLVSPSGYKPFELQEKTVYVKLVIDYKEGNRNQRPMEIAADFTVRNGLLEKED